MMLALQMTALMNMPKSPHEWENYGEASSRCLTSDGTLMGYIKGVHTCFFLLDKNSETTLYAGPLMFNRIDQLHQTSEREETARGVASRGFLYSGSLTPQNSKKMLSIQVAPSKSQRVTSVIKKVRIEDDGKKVRHSKRSRRTVSKQRSEVLSALKENSEQAQHEMPWRSHRALQVGVQHYEVPRTYRNQMIISGIEGSISRSSGIVYTSHNFTETTSRTGLEERIRLGSTYDKDQPFDKANQENAETLLEHDQGRAPNLNRKQRAEIPVHGERPYGRARRRSSSWTRRTSLAALAKEGKLCATKAEMRTAGQLNNGECWKFLSLSEYTVYCCCYRQKKGHLNCAFTSSTTELAYPKTNVPVWQKTASLHASIPMETDEGRPILAREWIYRDFIYSKPKALISLRTAQNVSSFFAGPWRAALEDSAVCQKAQRVYFPTLGCKFVTVASAELAERVGFIDLLWLTSAQA
ncbi:unnamed protein product [Toxocara canis]|uniref:CNH domain-containing protein n=1 Tax=Toxocara canis TaxID=6265 RepID=A0A183UXB4_TOXCA|nr:unnamed protein product [Toxocara canis]